MIMWKRPVDPRVVLNEYFVSYGDAEWDEVYSYREWLAPEFFLCSVRHRLHIGTLTMRPEQFSRDKPWLILTRSDLTVIDACLQLDPTHEIATGDFEPFEAAPNRRENEVEFLVVLNAVRNVMRRNPQFQEFLFTETSDF
jgi:hypothetical protein